MDDALYLKGIQCPVCNKQFEVTKVKSKVCKVLSRDSDFCVYYESVNPMLYEIWVCEFCGYAAQSDKFEEIRMKDAKIIKEKISPRWSRRSFKGERSIENALEAYKLALYNLQVKGAKSSEMARICMRIAWLYRLAGDLRENDFIRFAIKLYTETYEKERFPVEKLDEFTCMYMIAELNRRVDNKEEAVKWFSRLISSPDARRNPNLIEKAREQFYLIKEQSGQTDL